MDDSNATGALSWLLVLLKLLAIPLAFSLPQWLLIRRQFQKAAWWWIVARPLAWLTGFGLITLSDRLDPVSDLFWIMPYDVSSFVGLSIIAATFGFGFAAVTGAVFTSIQANQTVVRNHGN